MNAAQFIKSNRSTLALLAGVIAGGVCGIAIGPAVSVVKCVGDIFMNLVITLVVPLVFCSISSSICNLSESGKAGKVISWTLVVFVMMSVVVGLLSYFSVLVASPLTQEGREFLSATIASGAEAAGSTEAAGGMKDVGQAITEALSVSDFGMLLSKANIIPLIVAAILAGLGVNAAGEKGRAMRDLLESGTAVMMKIMEILMKAAPLGLGCYFAVLLSSLGTQVVGGYARVFVIYCVLAAVIFFGLNSLLVLLLRGKKFLPVYWKHLIPPCITAMAAASSTVAMPGNIEALRRMGVNRAVAESVIPFGTNIHKEGSVSLGIMKAAFIVLLTGGNLASPATAAAMIGVSIVTAVVVSAVPVGGLTSEILICMMLGADPSLAGLLIVVSILLDIPATLINSSGNVCAAVLVDKLSGTYKDETK